MEFLKDFSKPVLFIWNKIDKLSDSEKPALCIDDKKLIPSLKDEIYISAKSSLGIDRLTLSVKEVLTSGQNTTREQAGLGSARQKEMVEQALECAEHALVAADDNYTLDAVVQDLEDSLDFLGEVTGEITTDDVLENIFSRFCVGK